MVLGLRSEGKVFSSPRHERKIFIVSELRACSPSPRAMVGYASCEYSRWAAKRTVAAKHRDRNRRPGVDINNLKLIEHCCCLSNHWLPSARRLSIIQIRQALRSQNFEASLRPTGQRMHVSRRTFSSFKQGKVGNHVNYKIPNASRGFFTFQSVIVPR